MVKTSSYECVCEVVGRFPSGLKTGKQAARMSAVVENPKAAVKEMDALSSVTPRTGSRTPRTGTSTPRSVRSATPTHTNTTTDDEESVDKSDLPSYMRQTAASMTKRTRSRLEREGSW